MHFHWLAFYAGPDQVMTVTSGFASALGVMLLFWSKLRATLSIVLAKLGEARKSTAFEAERRKASQNY